MEHESVLISGGGYRAALSIVALLGGFGGLAGLYFVPIPEGNREALLLALGLVLGWGSTVISYEFGSSPAGRRAAEAGLRPTSWQASTSSTSSTSAADVAGTD